MVMEGMLWKWTNYFSGWQLRWFVLENGILSYYKSEDDVNNGCKGSVKVSACDVSVHPTDSTRLDLIIPGEAHFYVKSASPQERQQWLVALGTAKACLTTGSLSSSHGHDSPPDEERLRVKKSELRLYNDLLMQQVHSVKCTIQNKDVPNVEELNEATSLLGATCDTFIKTLDECVSLVNAKLSVSSSISESTNGGKPNSPTSHHRSSMVTTWNQTPTPRVKSAERCSGGGSRHHSSSGGIRQHRTRTHSCDDESTRTSDGSCTSHAHSSSGTPTGVKDDVFLECNGSHRDKQRSEESEYVTHLPTYFSNLDSSFPDIRLTADLEVPTIPFLDACRAILPIIDKLNENAFVPAKLDIIGNIKKIHQKYLSAPEKFQTVQKIVAQELSLGQCQLSSSATMALLWLTRTMQFIHGIIEGLRSDEEELRTIVNNAYGRSLRDYHGWVIRSAFAMAVRSVPTKQKLLQCFAVDDSHCNHPAFNKSVLLDLADQSAALSSVISILHSHLVDNGLNFPDQV